MSIEIFCFGSNEAGKHGKGAARFAHLKHGAIYGQGVGLQGYSYGIPTKDRNFKTLDLDKIKVYIEEFFKDAKINSVFTFNVTEIGCGLAGYTPEEIAPLFKDAMDIPNIKLPARFLDILEGTQDYSIWGISKEISYKQSFGYEY